LQSPKKSVREYIPRTQVRGKTDIKKPIVDRVNNLNMQDHSLIVIITGLVTALGLKEIWSIIKQKIDIKAKKEQRTDELSSKVIEELKNKIDALELKIDALIQENTELHRQVAKMEERLLQNARKKSARTQNRKSNG
jgi:outer membrane murein-binding lipoprotein Lpp